MFVYFFIGLFAANVVVSMILGRGKDIDFTKKDQGFHAKAKTLGFHEYRNNREV
jgi:hypothetical protein